MSSRRPAADTRTFIRVHDGIADHPKVEPLSDKAFRLLIETWAWCSRHHTDGKVPLATWNKRSSAKARAELVSSGLATMVGEFVEMHDYLEHQRSAEEIAEAIAARQQGGLLGNHKRWHESQGRVDPDCKYCSPKGSVGDRSTDRSGASLTDRFGSPETETDTETKAVGSARKRPATRLPVDWQPTDTHVAMAKARGLDLDREVFRFRNHAEANDRRQASWNAAFTTWLDKATDYGRPKAAGDEWRRWSEQ